MVIIIVVFILGLELFVDELLVIVVVTVLVLDIVEELMVLELFSVLVELICVETVDNMWFSELPNGHCENEYENDKNGK